MGAWHTVLGFAVSRGDDLSVELSAERIIADAAAKYLDG